MATKQILSSFTNTNADLTQVAFTATTYPMVVEAVTAANESTVNASYSMGITANAGTYHPQIQDKIIVWGENDLAIGIVNQVIPVGGTLSVKASAVDSIYFTVTGREIIT